MTFGYNAAAFVTPGETKTNDRLFAFGEQLLVALNDARIEDYQIRRPLVLVGHSLGGLVIKSVCGSDLGASAASDENRPLSTPEHVHRSTRTSLIQ
jgi:triacylglycerol esterase/lipase EstA (alpha/beta hydrolase family)